jgi:hypothetical protein
MTTAGSTLELAPDGSLGRIASQAGVKEEELAIIEVPCNAGSLYSAALEYAARHPEESGSVGPRPLWQSPDDAFEQPSDSDSEADDMETNGAVYPSECSDDCTPEAGSGLKKRRIPMPKWQFGVGETSVTWPPPAAMVAEIEREKAKKSSSSSKLTSPKRATLSPVQPPSSAAVLTTVYMVHFVRGEPVESDLCGGLTIYRALLLVGANGMPALQAFAKGVIKWRADKDRREGRLGRYALYRFKTDGGGGRGWWSNEGLKRARPAKSVTLADGQLESIMSDVRAFLAADTKRWYIDHGLPHRRSYLFYGVPGAGKTSTIRALATEFKLNCCFLTITKDVSTQILGDALNQIPENALLVLEDVDSLFSRDRVNIEGGALSFSGLLNALDGIMSSDGCVTVLTTNYIEKLDSALIRGGRVDRRFEFCRPSQQQLHSLFKSFYPGATDTTSKRFVDAIFARKEGDEARSVATLQQHFIAQRKASADECVDAIPDFYASHFPTGFGGTSDALYM